MLFGPLLDSAYRVSIADLRTQRQPSDPRSAARTVALHVDGRDVADPRLCLVNPDLSDFPPTQLRYGTGGVMHADDAEVFARRLAASRGRCDKGMSGLMDRYGLWPGRHAGGFARPMARPACFFVP